MSGEFDRWLDSNALRKFKNKHTLYLALLTEKGKESTVVDMEFGEINKVVWGTWLIQKKKINHKNGIKNAARLIYTSHTSPRYYVAEYKQGYRGPVKGESSSPPRSRNDYFFPALDFSSDVIFTDVIYEKFILPWWKKNVEANPDISKEAKIVVKEWVENPDNIPTMRQRFGEVAGSDAKGLVTLSLGIGTLSINPSSFINNLFNNTPSTSDDDKVLEALGLDEVIEQTARDMHIKGSQAPTIETLQENLANKDVHALKILKKAAGTKEVTAEEKLAFRQCVLVGHLLHEGMISTEYTYDGGATTDVERTPIENYWLSSLSNSPLHEPVDYSNKSAINYRVYPVKPWGFDPNNLVNICTVSKKIKTEMAKTGAANSNTTMDKYLFWVYTDADGVVREINIPLSSNILNSTMSRKIKALKKAEKILRSDLSSTTAGRAKAEFAKEHLDGLEVNLSNVSQKLTKAVFDFATQANTHKAGYYYMNTIGIVFDGTNPSTARSDVKVNIDFTLSSLAELNKPVVRGKNIESLHDSVNFRLMDLVTLPNTNSTETKSATGGWIRNQHDPRYSRIRLKVKAGADRETNLILDLTTIDHSIDRNSETGEVKLSINYRGYFESVLNMPENDVLSTQQDLVARRGINKLVNELITNTEVCKPSTVRKALRMQQAFAERNRDTTAASIINRILARRCMHSYTIDGEKMNTIDIYVDPTENYVESMSFQGVSRVDRGRIRDFIKIIEKDEEKRSDAELEDLRGDILPALGYNRRKFFFLGDLLTIAADCLYEAESAEHTTETKHLNLRFVLGTFYAPNPKNLDGPPIIINPASIPIDLMFFLEWFNTTVVNKDLRYYPIGTFIRDLIERLVNGVIYDTCFSMVLPDENPPIFRSQIFSTTDDTWHAKDVRGYFHPENPIYGTSYLFGVSIDPVDIMLHKNFQIPTRTSARLDPEVESLQYCVIYQQFPSFLSQMKTAGVKKLKDYDYTPTIFYGQGNEKHNFVSNVSFKKTDSPHLREARYFNTNYGSLSLLSNVYDLSFDFVGRAANTFFYPGVVINFILTDWCGKAFPADQHPGTKVQSNAAGGATDYSFFMDSNPHKGGTMANIMGMGGYYIVKSVEYVLGETKEEFEIKITTKFLGNDGNNPIARASEEEEDIETSATCVETHNQLTERANVFSDGEFFETISVGAGTPVSTGSPIPADRACTLEDGRSELLAHPLERYFMTDGQYKNLPSPPELSLAPRIQSRADRLAERIKNNSSFPDGTEDKILTVQNKNNPKFIYKVELKSGVVSATAYTTKE